MKISKIVLLIMSFIIPGTFSCLIAPNMFLWLIIFCGVSSPLIILINNFKKEDIFLRPVFWYFGSLFLWSITVIIDYLLGMEQYINETELLNTACLYALANIISTLAYLITNSFVKGKKSKSFKVIDSVSKPSLIASIILVGIGMLMLIYKVVSLGGIEALGIENRISNTQASANINSLSLPWQAPLNVGLVGLALIVRKRNLSKLLFLILGLSLFLILGFGARGDVLFVCLLGVIVILYRKNFFSRKLHKILIIISILLALSPFFSVSRNMIIYNKSLHEFESWELAYNRAETGGSFRVTMDVVNSNSIVQWPTNTYLTGAISFLPSVIYENLINERKFSPDKFFADTYYSERAKNGMSFGFSPVAEAWINGKVVGIVLVFGLLGVTIALSNRYIIPITILPSLMWFQRVSFDNFFSSVFFIIFFTILLRIITLLTQNKRKLSNFTKNNRVLTTLK